MKKREAGKEDPGLVLPQRRTVETLDNGGKTRHGVARIFTHLKLYAGFKVPSSYTTLFHCPLFDCRLFPHFLRSMQVGRNRGGTRCGRCGFRQPSLLDPHLRDVGYVGKTGWLRRPMAREAALVLVGVLVSGYPSKEPVQSMHHVHISIVSRNIRDLTEYDQPTSCPSSCRTIHSLLYMWPGSWGPRNA